MGGAAGVGGRRSGRGRGEPLKQFSDSTSRQRTRDVGVWGVGGGVGGAAGVSGKR